MNPISEDGRVAGVDYGTVRIGVSLSDPTRTVSSPYENYARRNADADATYFQQLVRSEEITLFVVGLPLHLSGQESPKSGEARLFAQWLRDQTGVPVVLYDERFTSVEAERMLLDAQLTQKRRKQRRDMLAAQILLSAFLEAGCPCDELA